MGIRSDPAHMYFLRVLLVEDDRNTRDTTAVWLSHLGHEVHMAADGRTALEVAEAIRPDVVLLDLGLAAMDGWEVARQLGKDPSATKPYIVAVTGPDRSVQVSHARRTRRLPSSRTYTPEDGIA